MYVSWNRPDKVKKCICNQNFTFATCANAHKTVTECIFGPKFAYSDAMNFLTLLRLLVASAWLAMLAPMALAQEQVITNRQTELKSVPGTSGKSITQLPMGSSLVIKERQPNWLLVESAGKRGWVQAAHVNTSIPITESRSQSSRGGFLSWFSAVLTTDKARASAGTSAQTRTTTIGIRGLGEDGANAAKANSPELQQLRLYAASHADADEFARNAKLTATPVAYDEVAKANNTP
jgi:hypothetical protein